MPPDVTAISGHQLFPRLSGAWRTVLLPLGAAWLFLLLAFASDWARIAAIAWTSSTFNHILLIPLILAWLVVQRLPELARIEPQPWKPALLLCGGAAMVWLLGAFSGLDLARQIGVVALMLAAVPLLLGVRASAVLAFPLGYALLLVPMGEELVPALQLLTAKITIALVELSGIPARIEGVFIDTPAGLFEVAEACSGVKFLIAMIALGLLVAHVCFRHWKRQALFMAACIAVPILANGIRAFATIWIAQSIGAERAVGFDHIVYGWFFFAIVVALVMAAAWPFFDRSPTDPLTDIDRIVASPLLARLEEYRLDVLSALAGLVLIAGVVLTWARAADTLQAQLPAQIGLPAVDGWSRAGNAPDELAWRPLGGGADHRLLGRYVDARGRSADVFVALYSAQGEGHEPGSFGQGALPPNGGWSWHSPGPRFADGKSELLRGDDGTLRLAVTWYISGPLVTGSNARLKLQAMADRLLLRERSATMLIISSTGPTPAMAERNLAAFVRDSGPPARWVDRLGITE